MFNPKRYRTRFGSKSVLSEPPLSALEAFMKVILSGIVGAALLALLASVLLGDAQRPAYEVFASKTGTRVGNPGENLVGSNWSGLNIEGPETGHRVAH
jgi:hypothetical protein